MNDKQQLAAMGEHLAEQQQQQPYVAKRIEGLDECEPFAWSYEWASCITSDGPQNFKAVIEREAPPQWAIDEGQARKVVPLYTTAPVVPEGWQLVPAKPTAKMVEICDNKYSGISRPPAEAIYRTMLAAAPKPEVTP